VVGADNKEPAISIVHMPDRSFIFDFLLFCRVSPEHPAKVEKENRGLAHREAEPGYAGGATIHFAAEF
jgi:hypothetical protein